MLADELTSQVTSSSVRLVSSTSRELKNEWFAPAGYSINVATANATQVLFLLVITYKFVSKLIKFVFLIKNQFCK